MSAYLLDVLPKLAARALHPPATNDDLDELLPDRWKRTHPEAVLKFREDERPARGNDRNRMESCVAALLAADGGGSLQE